jgi:hypothetical protein
MYNKSRTHPVPVNIVGKDHLVVAAAHVLRREADSPFAAALAGEFTVFALHSLGNLANLLDTAGGTPGPGVVLVAVVLALGAGTAGCGGAGRRRLGTSGLGDAGGAARGGGRNGSAAGGNRHIGNLGVVVARARLVIATRIPGYGRGRSIGVGGSGHRSIGGGSGHRSIGGGSGHRSTFRRGGSRRAIVIAATRAGLGGVAVDGGSSVARSLDDVLSGMLEGDGIYIFGDSAAVSAVGAEHGRETAETGVIVRVGRRSLALDLDSGTLHVHLTVSNSVPPEPRNNGLSGRQYLRNGKGNWIVLHSRIRRIVALVLDRMVALPGLDHTPDTFRGWALIVGDGELSRATTVYGRSKDVKLGSGAGSVCASRSVIGSGTPARKIASMEIKRGLGLWSTRPLQGIGHDHVCGGGAHESSESGNGCKRELHLGYCLIDLANLEGETLFALI